MLLTEPILMGIIALIGGAGGLFALIKSWMDYRENRAARIEDADERLVARLERKLSEAEARIAHLEAQHEQDAGYILELATALAKAGIDVPSKTVTKP